ncbi:PREDICTED: kelch-like protein 12 isoform X2 [Acropora digitifera]|uniref:kelch-like protein 12 isoform X2 n=1 Tax=Acropora digitifera TaxID=70779 RepID=UPI00077A5016|nr:PREDICTED: kelch-like protein 12 isoform X2 [Acropora digitifera]
MGAHSEILFSKCAEFREQGEFIDVRLKVGEDEFAAHRIILAASSDYFHAMFAHGMKESNQEVIELKDENISAAAMKIVMDFIYSGEINVNDENVFEVLTAADHLQVATVVEQCCKYLIQLRFDVQTYCRVIMFADQHSLKGLKEATENKMASMYKEICDKEEFLSDMNADVLSALLRRDDLSAPSENFVFQSVMQWIKYRKEERMDVAAKVIGAVRLGLVDVKDVIEELDTEEMQVISEINMLLQRTLIYNHRPSRNSAFALEKGKPRSMSLVLVAILPNNDISYFDVQSKTWKALSTVKKLPPAVQCYCAELIGNCLYVAKTVNLRKYTISCYDIVHNVWRTLPPIPGPSDNQIGSLCHIEDHLYVIYKSSAPYRFNLTTNQRQPIASSKAVCELGQKTFCNKAATVYKSYLFVLCGQGQNIKEISGGKLIFRRQTSSSVLFRFDQKKNHWEQKASTKTPHFGSSLFVVNNNLCVAGGRCSFETSFLASSSNPAGGPAAIEVYNDQENAWSVVKQTHIPPNNLGAVEIDGRVYFIINSFSVDSGIRIPPGEVYPVILDEWEKLRNIKESAVLCYVPLNTENLTTK